MTLFLVVDEDIPAEVLAVLGPYTVLIEKGRPFDVARWLLAHGEGSTETAGIWRLVTVRRHEAHEVSVLVDAVREQSASGEPAMIRLDELRIPVTAIRAAAAESGTTVALGALFTPDADATWSE
ncbi:MAG: hypothetical protein JF614_29100 [Acidobacteria bacterium]|nr:hypothetical protein [Acidobacteriota bacterium]